MAIGSWCLSKFLLYFWFAPGGNNVIWIFNGIFPKLVNFGFCVCVCGSLRTNKHLNCYHPLLIEYQAKQRNINWKPWMSTKLSEYQISNIRLDLVFLSASHSICRHGLFRILTSHLNKFGRHSKALQCFLYLKMGFWVCTQLWIQKMNRIERQMSFVS